MRKLRLDDTSAGFTYDQDASIYYDAFLFSDVVELKIVSFQDERDTVSKFRFTRADAIKFADELKFVIEYANRLEEDRA